MGEDFSAPVPIRLTCRYSNGVVVSYGARALAYNESSLRVLSSENFEQGIHLNVIAPFLEGVASCRVTATCRSRKQPPYFELDLKLVKKPVLTTRLQADQQAEQHKKGIPEEVVLAAQNLALALEKGAGRSFSQVLEDAPSRPLALLLAVAGVLLVLQGKSLLDVRHVLGGIPGRTAHADPSLALRGAAGAP
jgi:hypothetical protein